MQYSITLLAGIKKRQEFTGQTLVILETGAAATIDMSVELNGFSMEDFRGIKKNFKLNSPLFNGASFTASVDCTIEVIVSNANISIDNPDGVSVKAQLTGTDVPLAVVNDRGAPGTPLYVSGITYADAPAVTLVDNAAVAVTSAGAAIVAANAARRALRFTNIGTDPVAIGFTGITWAKRCIVIQPGDTWNEERAANLAWAAICDATKTASVTTQEVRA